jgi:hypothetical protein
VGGKDIGVVPHEAFNMPTGNGWKTSVIMHQARYQVHRFHRCVPKVDYCVEQCEVQLDRDGLIYSSGEPGSVD